MSGGTGLDEAIEYHVVNSLGWASLRPLQADSVEPVRAGADCVLIAPTAGGKTEAAVFPLLSSMVQEEWTGLSVLYVTPLRALLNNLYPRVTKYADWLGRRVGLWHGDVGDTERKRILAEPPDILLTTPESLEAMLVSRRVDHDRFFSGVRAIVVDELHAFAASDRGWHLLGVLARLERLAQRPIQRVGLSATVGNPEEIGRWLQGGGTANRELRVVSEEASGASAVPEVMLDYVGSVPNAAKVISSLHRGEKRLVFCESRRVSEQLAFELRELGVQTFVSHSSLSAEERRRSEQAFAEAQNTVIVATSTLELGIDIGDLDRVIQIDAPRTVASFLQRLGRTGRRPGTRRNTLFLATSSEAFLEAAGLLLLWQRGFVEPINPPPHPRHLTAQQLLALALQEGAYGASTWREWWGDLALMDDGDEVLQYLREEGFLVEDGGLLMIGPAAEKAFGRRHFMDLLSSFNAEKELRVVAGNKELGFISPLALPREGSAQLDSKPILMNGRAWHVEQINWERFEVLVSPVAHKGDVRWHSDAVALSFEVMRAQRDVLLGETPDVPLSRRAVDRLDLIRETRADEVSEGGLVVDGSGQDLRLWTWAGLRANETLRTALGGAEGRSFNEVMIVRGAGRLDRLQGVALDDVAPSVPVEMVESLKFSAALPLPVAVKTLAERYADRKGAAMVARECLNAGSSEQDSESWS
ncbi:DEAD/DEAH box helicase [Cellulomonas sp. zg-ZUI199]|uniref:DEAD/DEAH box helicase n=1 Tax=Cellulomonas wangleii TaxID=2816956 RepID=A0ABX8D4V5_9CELL|nr:DEAD/DEAH box helicase [Cellulomonas wangleii]MBO0923779.1 DEAD/DEAH box helicase [Cellulomonas wangleii]MBO0924061.1 DEAD/DEAH box helicase [Cellulomonas wangleii]QVI62086.1 DEAD/DEAH box helicase [Cellulomonas wangleii]